MTETVKISHMDLDGNGVAHLSTGDVAVPFTLPQETISLQIDDKGAHLVDVLEKAPTRVTPPCPYFEDCGGCRLQHWQMAAYNDWKRETVVTILREHGIETEIDPLIACQPHQRRRITLTVRQTTEGLMVGFNRFNSHTIVPIDDCPVARPAIVAQLETMRRIAAILAASNSAFQILVSEVDNGLDVTVTGTIALDDGQRRSLTRLVTESALLRLAVNDEIILETEKPTIRFGEVDVRIPPAAFLQATRDAEQVMAQLVCDGLKKSKRVADLFSGSGSFTFRLAKKSAVHAVEGEGAPVKAIELAAHNVSGLKPITTEQRDLFRRPLLLRELEQFDGVVFDPPRAGARAQAQELAKSNITRVVAVSCNPQTLVRDLTILIEGGYRIDRVIPIDQFLWSSHVEVVVFLSKKRPKPGWKL